MKKSRRSAAIDLLLLLLLRGHGLYPPTAADASDLERDACGLVSVRKQNDTGCVLPSQQENEKNPIIPVT
jgi:hypothetical protein